VSRLLTELDTLERRVRDLRLSLERVGDGELAAKLIADKTRIDREIGEAQGAWDDRKRQLSAVQVELKQKRQEISNKREELRGSGKSADRADFARRVKRAIEAYKEALRPRKRDELAKHLGTMYRHLARKEDVVRKIELDERTFSPRLLDRRGDSIPLDSQSAGEREIYALSLLWALGKTSRRDLPVVIDTPLARLDSAHRANIVMRYLPEAGSQVIVLSTDTEIDRKYFDMIEQRIAMSLRLDFDPETERTRVREGYFDFR
jgi:DNA sulfur modification protein DndD